MFQTAVIIVGLTVVAFLTSEMAGGAGKVIAAASDAGKFRFWPSGGGRDWLAFLGAWLTLALGSIPQQDVFQRVTSARDSRTAVRGTLTGGLFYFAFAFVPIFIAYSAVLIDPASTALFKSEDAREVQRILPDLILDRMPVWAQVMFFGALLSAILSTASGALLAPTALFTENALKTFFPGMGDRRFMIALRMVLVVFAVCALLFALNSRSTMYEMVQNAYKVTLVGAFVPLAAGIYWKRATTQGALFSVALGIASWLLMEIFAPDAAVPPQLTGLSVSLVGMVAGSLLPQRYGGPRHQAA
jgi:Na+/proline symporter